MAVQSKIYDAQKTLAHQAYDEQIASDDAKIEADRGDWKKELADWDKKLADIKAKFKEQSKEYQDAYRQMEAAQREHQQQVIRDELSGDSKEIAALQQHLAAMRQLRETDAATAESIIKERANGEILGEVRAAAQIGALHLQLAQQEIADAELIFAKQDALRQKGLADTLKADGAKSDAYKAALQVELDAERKFQDQVKLLQAKATQQQIADIKRGEGGLPLLHR